MGPYLSQPNTQIKTKTETLGGIRYTSCEMQGWRKTMEDARIAELEVNGGNGKVYSIFGVFDGHGGSEVSKYVQAHFVDELQKDENFRKGDIPKALEQTFRKMDELMKTPKANEEMNQFRKNMNGANSAFEQNIGGATGCTANVVVIDDKNIYSANSGDSRAALCRGGKLVVLSQDHKPQSQIQRSRVEKAGGVIMNGRVNGGLNLTRALGDFQYKNSPNLQYNQQMITCQPDLVTVPRHPNDEFIIMGCDGIWQRYVTDSQHMIDHIISQRNVQADSKIVLENMLKGMVAKATNEEIGCDNMTSILIEFLKN